MQIIAIGGGKGGVGKSILSVAISFSLCSKGNRVILIDLDLGAANLHTYLGLKGPLPSIRDFFLKKTSSLEELIVPTKEKNLFLISGAGFVPGIANPAYWMKLKTIKHIRNLRADYIVVDLGAGVNFNVLDFFCMADRGVVITAAEPGAVINAYSFIKAAFLRRLQQVFRHEPTIRELIDKEAQKDDRESRLTIPWLKDIITFNTPELVSVMQELEREFRPFLVLNRAENTDRPVIVKNLIRLCHDKLGIEIIYAGNLPDVKRMSKYLLNITELFSSESGKSFIMSVDRALDVILGKEFEKTIFSDDDIEEISSILDSLDDSVFKDTTRNALKLKLYFRPYQVIEFLNNIGIKIDRRPFNNGQA